MATRKKKKILSAQNVTDDDKELLDPVLTSSVGSMIWFAAKASMQAIIGFVAVQFFAPAWRWIRKKRQKSESGDHQEISSEE